MFGYLPQASTEQTNKGKEKHREKMKKMRDSVRKAPPPSNGVSGRPGREGVTQQPSGWKDMRARLSERAGWPESGRSETPTVDSPHSLRKNRSWAGSREQRLLALRDSYVSPESRLRRTLRPAEEGQAWDACHLQRHLHPPAMGSCCGFSAWRCDRCEATTATVADDRAWGAAGAGWGRDR